MSSDVSSDLVEIDNLVNPSVVAVVGVSETKRTAGRIVADALLLHDAARVYMVNGRTSQIGGHPTFPDLSVLPEVPETVVIAVPGAEVLNSVTAGLDLGCRHFIILSATKDVVAPGGRLVDDELRDLIRERHAVIMGSASGGMLDFNKRVYLGFSTLVEDDEVLGGDIAMVAQSGGVATYACAVGMRRGLGFSHFATTGTEVGLDVCDMSVALASKPEVSIVCMYMENLTSGAKLVATAREIARQGKVLVLFWAGRSQRAQTAARSHTGALAVPHRFIEGVCAQTGAVLTGTPEECLDAIMVAKNQKVRSSKTAIVSVSGGFSVIMSDIAADAGVDLVQLSDITVAKLEAVLPVNSAAMNPVDLGAAVRDPSILGKVMPILAEDANVENIVVFTGHGGDFALAMADAIVAARPDIPGYYSATWLAPPREAVDRLRTGGVDVYERTEGCLYGLASVAGRSRATEEVSAPTPDAVASAEHDTALVDEVEAKKVIAKYGVPVPRGGFGVSPEDAARVAESLAAKVVLKVVKEDLLHKSAAGGVALGLEGVDEVLTSARRMSEAFDGKVNGFLVEEMVAGGVELLIGLSRDERLGPFITLGVGGVDANGSPDHRVRPVPIGPGEVVEMLDGLREGRLLRRLDAVARNRARERVSSICNALIQCFQDDPLIETLEVNPLLIDAATGAAVAVDTVILQRSANALAR